jgi:hypothetical protein
MLAVTLLYNNAVVAGTDYVESYGLYEAVMSVSQHLDPSGQPSPHRKGGPGPGHIPGRGHTPGGRPQTPGGQARRPHSSTPLPEWIMTVTCIAVCMVPGGSTCINPKYDYPGSTPPAVAGGAAAVVEWTVEGTVMGHKAQVPGIEPLRQKAVAAAVAKFGAKAVSMVAAGASGIGTVALVIDGVMCTGTCTGSFKHISDGAERLYKEADAWALNQATLPVWAY